MKYRIWDKKYSRYLNYRTHNNYINQSGEVCIEDKGGFHLPLNQEDFIVELSTGLKDKNGKEIYEGDIIQHYAFDLDDTFVVKWYEEDACFDGDGSTREWRDCEVVGNINEEDNE